MSDLRDRIAAVQVAHWVDEHGGCTCGVEFVGNTADDWPAHVADAVIRDVLTPEFLADLVIAAVQKAADDE
jgi:hypothetical protein